MAKKKSLKKKLPKILYKLALIEFSLLLVIFPLGSFRINMASMVFPALEVILLYYFSTIHRISFVTIFIVGLFFDQLYSMPIGSNSLIFITAHALLSLLSKYFILKSYLTNFIIFCFYYFYIIHFRYLLILAKNLSIQGYFIMIMQYLTTIFSYNLLRIPFDKSLEYSSRRYAK
ncbi:MAG: hypothetical protein RCG15_01935 [Candidatus Rickettsia vulgarisii]